MYIQGKEIPNYPNHVATADGKIWSKKKKRFLKGTLHVGRYLAVQLKHNDRKFIHELILETFVGPRPNNAITRHLNGNRTDNRLCNLCWGTARENALDRNLHGTQSDLSDYQFKKGSEHPSSTLTPLDVIFIRAYRKLKQLPYAQLSEWFNVNKATIGKIVKGERWTHIPI